jgi:hypothetical protein
MIRDLGGVSGDLQPPGWHRSAVLGRRLRAQAEVGRVGAHEAHRLDEPAPSVGGRVGPATGS